MDGRGGPDKIRKGRSPARPIGVYSTSSRLSSTSSSQTRHSNVSQAYSTSPKALVSFPSLSPEPDSLAASPGAKDPKRKVSTPVKSVGLDRDTSGRPRSQSASITQAPQSSALNRTMKGAVNLRKSIMAALTGAPVEPALTKQRKPDFLAFDEESDPLHKATDEQVQRLIENKGGPIPTIRQFSADVAESNHRAAQERNSRQAMLDENRLLRHENEELKRANADLEERLESARELLRRLGGRVRSDLGSASGSPYLGDVADPSEVRSLHSFVGLGLDERIPEDSEAENVLSRVTSAPTQQVKTEAVERLCKINRQQPRDVAPIASRRTGPRRSIPGPRQKSETLEMKGPVDEDSLPPALREFRKASEDGSIDRLGFLFTANREQRHQAVVTSQARDPTESSSVESYPLNDGDSASSLRARSFVEEEEPGATVRSSQVSNSDLLCYAPVGPPLRLVSFGANGQQKFVDILKAPPASAQTPQVVEAVVTTLSDATNGQDVKKEDKLDPASPEPTPPALVPPQLTRQASEQGSSEGFKALNSLLNKLNDTYDVQQQRRLTEWKTFETQVRQNLRQQSKAAPGERVHDYSMSSIANLCTPTAVSAEIMKRFHTLLAMGVPVSLRQEVWLEKTGANAMRVPGRYESLLSEDFTLSNNGGSTDDDNESAITAHDIAADVERTLANNIYFRSGTGRSRLSQVLTAYSRHNPSIGYSQGLNIIAANLLLLCTTAEDAFWLLAAVITNVLPSTYYDREGIKSAKALETDGAVLSSYVKDLLPKLHEHLSSVLGIDLTLFTPGWFISAFAAALSGEALFRFWDLLFGYCDGRLVFCIALALLKVNRKSLMACDSYEEGMLFLGGRMTSAAVGLDVLIREVLRLANEVEAEEVARRRERFGSG